MDAAPSLPPLVNTPHLSTHELTLLEQNFRARLAKSGRPEYRLSRLRLYVIFLLARHAALRLGEILAFHDERDLDLDAGLLRVSGPQARELPIPHHLDETLRTLFAHPFVSPCRGELARLDPGYVRRNFYARARECGLPPELSSPRALRQARAAELLEGGMPLPAVQKFLGQPTLESTGGLFAYTDADIHSMTRHYLHRESKLKTSARNVFPGKVSAVRQSGFLAEVHVTGFTGLSLVSVITEESLENLQLSTGKTVVATVKAPWVVLARSTGTRKAESRNMFEGVVSHVTRSDIACEVVVDLPEGSRICALLTTHTADELNLAPGSPVVALIKAFAVILTIP